MGYISLIKYYTNKTAYTKSSLSSIAEQFAVRSKHSVGYLDNENHYYEQYLVQRIQLQTWTAKKSKILPSSTCCFLQLESTQAGGNFLVAVALFSAILLLQKNINCFELKNGLKDYGLCHQGADLSRVVTEIAKNSTTATSNVYQVHLHVSRQLLFVAQTRIFDF